MSLQRLLLRTAWVGALKGATIAQDRVFDSRIGPIQQSKIDDWLPYIAVYSDVDKAMNMATPGGDPTPVWLRTVDIVLEIGVGQLVPVTVEPPQGNPEQALAFNVFETDAELSMALDLLELQIARAFWADRPAASRLRRLIKNTEEWSSIAGFSAEANIKIAARQITVRCIISNECVELLAGLIGFAGAKKGSGAFPPLAEQAPYLAPILDDLAQAPAFESLRDMLQELNGDKPIPELQPGFRVSMRWGNPSPEPHVNVDLNLEGAS